MPPTATSEQTGAAEAPAQRLADILPAQSGPASDAPDSGAPADTEIQADTGTDATPEQTAADEFDESTLYPQDGETDFADAVYARAAEHWSKQFGAQLNPSDPLHRQVLRELIQRGQKINELQTTQPAADEAADESEAEVAEQPTQQPTDSPEQIKQFLDATFKFAGEMVRPEVATAFTKNFIGSLYGPKEAEKITPEGAAKFTQVMTHGVLMVLNDLLPRVAPDLIGNYVEQNFPVLGNMHSQALEGQAIKELSAAKNAQGLAYPGLSKLVQDGVIEAVYAENPELRDGQFFDLKTGAPLSPLANKKRELHVVYQIARGRTVNPALLKQVAEKGKEQALKAQRTAAASKLAAGESKGAFQPTGSFIEGLIKRQEDSAQGRFSRAAQADEAYRTHQDRRSGRA